MKSKNAFHLIKHALCQKLLSFLLGIYTIKTVRNKADNHKDSTVDIKNTYLISLGVVMSADRH